MISGSVIAGLGVTLFLLYRQAKKLIEYNLKVKRLKVEKISMNDLRLKIFMLFKNPSKLTIVLTKPHGGGLQVGTFTFYIQSYI